MNIYITDGTENCFFTAVFDAYSKTNSKITSSNVLQLSFDCNLIYVQTDEEKAERVKSKLRQYDARAINDIRLILRYYKSEREQIAFEYLKRIIQLKAPARDRLNEQVVINARDAHKKVTKEAHHFKGFLRFIEGANGIYYAPFEPDNDILEIIAPHFISRFKNQAFIIHDTKRKTAMLYNTKDCVFTTTDDKVSICVSDYEKAFQVLWKQYYNSVNIKERPHEKQMKAFMPVRYWKHMPEKQ